MSQRQLGPYQLLEELGRGGMGSVFRARDSRTDREVALKLATFGGVSPAERHELSARFLREAQAMARLQHPGVVAIHDVGRDPSSGQAFMAMQLVRGSDLGRRLRERGPLPQREAVGLTRALARALGAAHARGILHRDLKPANVLLDGDGRPYLADFGLAKLLDRETRLTLSGDALGTPSYMAPEQALGDHGAIGPATDVFGLGAVLYAMLTGSAPYSAPSVVGLLQLAAKGTIAPASSLRPDLDPRLSSLLERCLQREPEQRFASCAELEQALAALEDTLGSPAARSIRLPLLVAVGVASALGASVWATRRPAPADPAPPAAASSPDSPPDSISPATQATPGGPAADPETLLREAIALESTRAQPRLELAEFLIGQKDHERAHAVLAKVFELDLEDPDLMRAYWTRARVHVSQVAAMLAVGVPVEAVRADVRKALEDIARAEALGFSDPKLELTRAGLLVMRRDFVEALASYERELQAHPASLQAWTGKAAILRLLGRHQESLQAYEDSAHLAKQSVPGARDHAEGLALTEAALAGSHSD